MLRAIPVARPLDPEDAEEYLADLTNTPSNGPFNTSPGQQAEKLVTTPSKEAKPTGTKPNHA